MTSVTFGDFVRYTHALRAVNLCPDDFWIKLRGSIQSLTCQGYQRRVSIIEIIQKCLNRFPNSGTMFGVMHDHPDGVTAFPPAMQQQVSRAMFWLDKHTKL